MEQDEKRGEEDKNLLNSSQHSLTDEELKNRFLTKPPEAEPEPIPLHILVEDTFQDIEISRDGEEPRHVKVSTSDLQEQLHLFREVFKEYWDIFAHSYEELLGVDPKKCQHRIPLLPCQMKPYRLSDNYRLHVKEELDKLLACGFIYEAEESEWAAPITVVSKKNSTRMRVCVNYKKLNNHTIHDPFPLPFSDFILDTVASSECFSFMDGFSGHNQIAIALEDQHKTTFVTEWRMYDYRVMSFGLHYALATFQRYMMLSFMTIRYFLEIYLDDICDHTSLDKHLATLRVVFALCREAMISLNPNKCLFGVRCGPLLGHIVSREGIMVDPKKVKVIQAIPPPTTLKEV